MNMLRHYFISTNLDDLEVFEEQLEAARRFHTADPRTQPQTTPTWSITIISTRSSHS